MADPVPQLRPITAEAIAQQDWGWIRRRAQALADWPGGPADLSPPDFSELQTLAALLATQEKAQTDAD